MPETFAAAAEKIMTPEMAAAPHPIYDVVRPHSPFKAISRPGTPRTHIWPLMKYQDVYHALKDHETFSSATRDDGGEGGGGAMRLGAAQQRPTTLHAHEQAGEQGVYAAAHRRR